MTSSRTDTGYSSSTLASSPTLSITPSSSVPSFAPTSGKLNGDARPNLSSTIAAVKPSLDPVKRLFICCDGTWKNASGTQEPQTNLARLARSITRMGRKSGNRPCIQIVYYAAGVGAAKGHRHWPDLLSGVSGSGLEADLLDAYCFLSNNFTMGGHGLDDEIVLAGYSRGAFTVRCLASLIDTVGLLRRRWLPLLPIMFGEWKLRGQQGPAALEAVTAKYRAAGISSFVHIKVLAEWEPVSATRVLKFVARDATVPRCVEHTFVAVSHDERRLHFAPILWRQWPEHDAGWDRPGAGRRSLRQVVFRGGHGDIGGGHTDSGLATVPLLWMVAQIMSVSNAEFDNSTLFETILPMPASKAWLQWGGPGDAAQSTVESEPPPLHYVDVLRSRGDFVRPFLRRVWEAPSKLGIKAISGDRTFAFRRFFETCEEHVEPTLKTHFTVDLLQGQRGKLWDRDANAPVDPGDWANIHSYEVLLWRRWRKHIQTNSPMPWDKTPDRLGPTRWQRAAEALNLVELPREPPVVSPEQKAMANYMTTDTLLGRLLIALVDRYSVPGATHPDSNVETDEENDADHNMDELDPVIATHIDEMYRNVTNKKHLMTLK